MLDVMDSLGMLAFQRGDMAGARERYASYRKYTNKPSVFIVIREALAANSLNLSADDALKSIQTYDLKDDWEKSLLAYHREELEEGAFLGLAENVCNKTEANYFVAYRALLAGNKAKAREHFKKVLSYKLSAYYEYPSAKRLLKTM